MSHEKQNVTIGHYIKGSYEVNEEPEEPVDEIIANDALPALPLDAPDPGLLSYIVFRT
jgi:hypothetical protein